ncbi:LysR family transcriptional regulator [Nocardioides zeae]|uniref:LysR family transcriptional regulator n=1 Tax=Nocardioides imazamoxiresistens TaxID=3231893 RepID=A0ABU3Q0L6_9ACTN|nr:LysR family transcriptional regulator [Nocardioides zeae]MDT9595014.1 LysR family transcriptional regulator [Nocardioides zeae]
MSFTLDLEHLRTIVAIAECGGFSRAAAARHISQPALSQHVRILERGLKRKLFEKEGRGMRFTAEGEALLSEARQILSVHDQALARLQVRQEQVVVVGSTEHSAEHVLPQMIRALADAFPDVTTRFEIGRSTVLEDSVGRGAIDLAFVLASRGNEGGREIGRLPLSWFASPTWDATGGETINLVAFEEPCALRERAMAALSAEGYRVNVAAQSTTLEGVLAGVRAGLGVALLPSVAGRVPSGVVRRGDLPEVGSAGLNLMARRGLDPDIEMTAIEAGEAFLATSATSAGAPVLQVAG